MTAIDDWIAQLAGGKYSDNPQTLISTVATAIAALQLLQAGVGGSAAANLVFAGPASGIPAAATFRSLVAADLATTLLLSVGNINLNSTTKPASAGLFSPAANQLGVGINSAEVARFIASGMQVGSGIGTAAIFNDYETGTWTPADSSGAGLVFTGVVASYTRLANIVHAYCSFNYPATADASATLFNGLPFTVANAFYAIGNFNAGGFGGNGVVVNVSQGGTTGGFKNANTVGSLTNANCSGQTIRAHIIYPIA